MKKIFILVVIIMYCFMDIGFCADGFYVIPVGKSRYAIGDTGPAGGKVFYITPSSGGKHGIEAAPTDQSSSAVWGCPGTLIDGATGTAVGAGADNSIEIVRGCDSLWIAADVAQVYKLNGISGWYLPSRDELNLMYLNLHIVGMGGFENNFYWSSSQYNQDGAKCLTFANGVVSNAYKGISVRVRAVRDF